jgi:hypothetical protein
VALGAGARNTIKEAERGLLSELYSGPRGRTSKCLIDLDDLSII